MKGAIRETLFLETSSYVIACESDFGLRREPTVEPLVGQSLGRYEVTGYIGAGGMGVVYRARDTELGRDVAIKVLNDRAASEPSRIERFSREARAVARLSHPNILDIHDFGTHDGTAYAVTELLKGQTLADRLQKGQIPLKKGLEICGAIAEGLAAAHGEGIVHRDVKPSNIFITDTGQVKVLDFGIARLREQSVEESSPGSEAATESMTGAGRMVGTVGYMSPEQIEGRKVDGRSDIFGLGCVMYEVLTGKRAFRGKTSSDTMMAILGKDPEPIRSLNPDVPQAVELVVERCLEKQPGERFESARDVAFSVQALADSRDTGSDVARPVLVRIRRRRLARDAVVAVAAVAVVAAAWVGIRHLRAPAVPLPAALHLAVIDFSAPEGDKFLGELAAGLTETVSASLRLLERQTHGSLWVVPRRLREPGAPWSLDTVARDHGITVGLEGRLQSRNGSLQLELVLRVPGDDTPLRSVVIEDQLDNLISFQESPLVEVAALLGIEPEESTLSESRSVSTNVVPAFTSYLSGVGWLVRATDDEKNLEAIAYLEKAVELDPTYKPAQVALLRSCALLIERSGGSETTAYCSDQLENAKRNDSSDLMAAAASVYGAQGEENRAVEALRFAVKERPDDAELQLQLGKDLMALDDLDSAENAMHRAIDLRPDFWEGHFYLGYVEYVRGRYEATANAWRVAVRCAPQRSTMYSNLAAVFHALDRRDEALEVLERAVEVSEDVDAAVFSNLGTLYFEDARYAEAAASFERAVALEDSDYLVWGNLAWSYASGVDTTKAVEPFQRAAVLGEEALLTTPDDPILLARLAGYHGMLENKERGLELIEQAISLVPDDPIAIATIGETLEDLEDRERALDWIGRALREGVPRNRFESHPSLRDLVADERYQRLVIDPDSNGGPGLS